MLRYKINSEESVINFGKGLAWLVLSLVIVGMISMPLARADQFDNQINIINQQNAQAQQVANSLLVQATSYQDAIDRLQAQINIVQQQITTNQQQQAQLNAQIAADQAKLDYERKVLGEDLKNMYIDGQMSAIEELATSKNLSDYVDKEEYRVAIQNKITTTLQEITLLQEQLQKQNIEVGQLLVTENSQNDQLASNQAQQSQLLNYTDSQKAQYDQQIQANNAQIATLRAEQAAAYRAAFSGSSSSTGGTVVYRNLSAQQLCGGGYDFHCADGQDNYLDNWGEYNRECVSYAALMMARAGHYVPDFGDYKGTARGNAYQWQGVLEDSGAADIISGSSVSSTAALVGDVVYMPIGGLGHVGVVLSDDGGGWVHVGQYNIWDEGEYSEMDLKVTPNLTFFHFH